jgi:ribosome-associated translation inhibitor RaiA
MTIPIHTEHKVTLTEGQISVILNSLDYTLDRWEQTGYHCEEDQQAIDSVYKELEGTIDKYYEKVEKAQAKQPTPQWD